jgi:hypothetical protein
MNDMGDDEQPPELQRRRQLMREVLISPGDAARMVGVSSTWLRTLDDRLRPVFDKKNGRRSYRLDLVEAYMTERNQRMWTKYDAITRGRTSDAMVVVEIARPTRIRPGDQWRIDDRKLSGRVLAVEHVGREVYGHEITRLTIDVNGFASSGLFLRNLPLVVHIEVAR